MLSKKIVVLVIMAKKNSRRILPALWKESEMTQFLKEIYLWSQNEHQIIMTLFWTVDRYQKAKENTENTSLCWKVDSPQKLQWVKVV